MSYSSIVPECKIALIIGISDYCKSKPQTDESGQGPPREQDENCQFVPKYKSLEKPIDDARAMKKLLSQFGYETITNIDMPRPTGHKDDAPSQDTFKFVEHHMDQLFKRAAENAKQNMYTHLFFYFSGHGVISGDLCETCGVDGNGDLIPWEKYAKKFSQSKKTLSFFFLDCCREKSIDALQKTTTNLFGSFNGIVIMKYSCDLFKRAVSLSKDPYSKSTAQFIELLSDKSEYETKEILSNIPNCSHNWSILQRDWGEWILFNPQKFEPTIASETKMDSQDISKAVQNLLKDATKEYEDGSVYKGQMLDGQRHGYGIFYFGKGEYEGQRFEGNWRYDMKHGIGIHFDEFSRKVFEGKYEQDQANGHGVLFHKNNFSNTKSWFEGEWLNGLLNGRGVEYYQDETIKYDGSFENGEYSGHGKLLDQVGNVYIGTFKNGLKHGTGSFSLHDGSKIYDGEYKNGFREGRGQMYFEENGWIEYEGFFAKGVRSGQGKQYLEKNRSTYYEGNFKNNNFHGPGMIFASDGSRFEGWWRRGKQEGVGQYFQRDGGKGPRQTYNNGVLLTQQFDSMLYIPQCSLF